MTARSGRCRMMRLAGMLVLVPIALALVPAPAFGIFPPVIQKPAVAAVATVPIETPVTIQGDPGPVPIPDPVTASTPEPATLITGLIGLAFGRCLLRRKKVQI